LTISNTGPDGSGTIPGEVMLHIRNSEQKEGPHIRWPTGIWQ